METPAKKPTKKTSSKAPAKKTPAKKAPAKKAPAKKATAKKAAAKKAPVKAVAKQAPQTIEVEEVPNDKAPEMVEPANGNSVIRVNEVKKRSLRLRMAQWFKKR